MRAVVVGSLILLFPCLVKAQYAEEIRSGRPGIAIGPYTTGKRVFQNQTGYYYRQFEKGDSSKLVNQDLVSVFRCGITEQFELGGAVVYSDREVSQAENFVGFSALSVAMRSNVYQGDGLIPAFGYQVNIDLPNEAFENRNRVAPRVTLMTRQKWKELRIITNFQIVWNGLSTEPAYLAALFSDIGISKKTRFFAEYFIQGQEGNFISNVDVGFTYLLNRDIQFDIQGGHGLWHDNQVSYFASVGIGWRVRWIERPIKPLKKNEE